MIYLQANGVYMICYDTHIQANRKFQVVLLEDNRSIVLCQHEAKACHDEILKRHRISTHVQL